MVPKIYRDLYALDAPEARDNWTTAFFLYIWNIFQEKFQFSEPLGLNFQNKIPLILLHKDI